MISAARHSLHPRPHGWRPLTTPQASLHAADRIFAPPLQGLLTLGFDPTRFQMKPPACYRATWQLPEPDSHRQATTSLRTVKSPHRQPPVPLDARKIEANFSRASPRRGGVKICWCPPVGFLVVSAVARDDADGVFRSTPVALCCHVSPQASLGWRAHLVHGNRGMLPSSTSVRLLFHSRPPRNTLHNNELRYIRLR